jgi:hypothetical protein
LPEEATESAGVMQRLSFLPAEANESSGSMQKL